MEPGIAYTPNLARCLQLNALALAFSLAHTVADYGVIFATTDFNTWGVAAYLGLSGAVYGWWGWSMAQAVRGSRGALLSLLALSGIWAILHGATFPFTPLTYILADIIHFGSLLFGLWAAYATWRVLRGGRFRTLTLEDDPATRHGRPRQRRAAGRGRRFSLARSRSVRGVTRRFGHQSCSPVSTK